MFSNSFNKIRIKKILPLVGIFLILLLLVPQPAHAVEIEIGSRAVALVIGNILSIIFEWVGKAISLFSQGLDYFIRIDPASGITVVSEAWKIMRNFANMFFIVALIILAFATIFGVGGAGYEWKAMLGKLIVAALLINFSLIIGQIIIKGSQELNNVLLASMGSVGDKLGDGLDPGALVDNLKPDKLNVSNPANVLGTALFAVLFSIVALMAVLFSLLVALFFLVIRIPFLWFLLIISPIVWIAYIFPFSIKFNKWWWKEFIAWNLFLPIFLFALYFGVYFLSKQDELIIGLFNTQQLNQGFFGNFSLQMIFFYALVSLFLIGGPLLAFQVGQLGGTYSLKAAGWAKGATKALPIFSIPRAAGGAVGMKVKDVQKQGFQSKFMRGATLGYRGQEAQEERVDTFSRWMGVRGIDLLKQSENRYKELKRKFDQGQLTIEEARTKGLSISATKSEGLAYRRLLAEEGALTDNELTATINATRERNALAANNILQSAIKSGSVRDTTLAQIARDRSNPILMRRGVIKQITEKADPLKELYTLAGAAIPHAEQVQILENMVIDAGGPNSGPGKAFLKAAQKVRPDLVYDYRAPIPAGNPGAFPTPTTRTQFYNQAVGEPKDIYNAPDQFFDLMGRGAAPNIPFIRAIANKINSFNDHNARSRFISKLVEESFNTPNGAAKLDVLRTHINPVLAPLPNGALGPII